MRLLWMPLSSDWRPPSGAASFCCEEMARQLEFTCQQHTDPFECADQILVYNEIFDEVGLVVHDGGASYILIAFCPWCGARQPESQRDRWFDETEAKGYTEETMPPEYRSGEWRRAK